MAFLLQKQRSTVLPWNPKHKPTPICGAENGDTNLDAFALLIIPQEVIEYQGAILLLFLCTHPDTQESLNNLIDLYEAWNKPEKGEEWLAKLPEAENMRK